MLPAVNQVELLALRFDTEVGPLWGVNARRSGSFAAVGQVVGNEPASLATDTRAALCCNAFHTCRLKVAS